MLVSLYEVGRKTWPTNMKLLLYKLGFGFAWISRENENLFLNEVTQRLKDVAMQYWHSGLNQNSKLSKDVQLKILNVEICDKIEGT